jgi:hypothetical protein
MTLSLKNRLHTRPFVTDHVNPCELLCNMRMCSPLKGLTCTLFNLFLCISPFFSFMYLFKWLLWRYIIIGWFFCISIFGLISLVDRRYPKNFFDATKLNQLRLIPLYLLLYNTTYMEISQWKNNKIVCLVINFCSHCKISRCRSTYLRVYPVLKGNVIGDW